jgi:hypothetical protein
LGTSSFKFFDFGTYKDDISRRKSEKDFCKEFGRKSFRIRGE